MENFFPGFAFRVKSEYLKYSSLTWIVDTQVGET